MYTEYFNFKESPFSIAPNPRYLYMSQGHQEALAHLMYGFQHNGGFILLTGEVGTGKTTTCRCLLEQIPEDTDVAFVINSKVSEYELLANICDELQLDYPKGTGGLKDLIDPLNHFLLENHAKNRKTLLIIDEAQNLPPETLEQLRLLTNLETNDRKLLQILLLGQPELNTLLAQPHMRQLAQRITARYHLYPLNPNELKAYIHHRLKIAGGQDSLFSDKAIKVLFKQTQGVPRLVNIICDRALLGTYATNRRQVDAAVIRHATREVLGNNAETKRQAPHPGIFAAGLLLMALTGLGLSPWGQQARGFLNPAAIHTPSPAAVPTESTSTPIITSTQQTQAQAYRSLFKIWDSTPPLSQPSCRKAPANGLACLEARGSWTDITQLNRPTLLHLRSPLGEESEILVTGINKAQIKVLGPDESVLLDKQLLSPHWDGHYALLWKPPANYDAPIHPGQPSALINWLNLHLASYLGLPPLPQQQHYATDLVTRVKQFQVENGLKPDGIVGPKTLIQLNSQLRLPGPRLSQKI